MDGNYYYHYQDINYKRRREALSQKTASQSLDRNTNVNNVDLSRCDILAENLPLSLEFRPSWDVTALSKLGFDDIGILYTDSEDYSYDTGYGKMHTPVSFGLCARLPRTNVSFYGDKMHDELENAQSIIDSGTEAIVGLWKVLSNKDCVKLLLTLYTVDLDASQAASILKCSYSLASHDLKLLKDCGLVVSEKIDSKVVYSLSNRQVIRDLYFLTSEVKYGRIDEFSE